MKKKIFNICGVLFFLFVMCLNLISAEKLNIDIGNNYLPGEAIEFKIILYNDNNEQIPGQIDYIIKNYYSDIINEGIVNSGETIKFKLPENSVKGPWEISALYKNIMAPKTLFNVGELEKANIKLEEDSLIVENIGNVAYDKDILIYIGNIDQTAMVHLEVGQTKIIKLTAPEGEYNIRVVSEDANFEVEGVSLTGNVIGLERVLGDSFFEQYPLISLFLVSIMLLIIFVAILKFYDKITK